MGTATIDGLSFPMEIPGIGPYDAFAVGHGSGFATFSNLELNQFASVSLIGYVNAQTLFCTGSGNGRGCGGGFVVLPTPEPGSFAFGMLGLGVVAIPIAIKRTGSWARGARRSSTAATARAI
jgi:hypothetical protein